MMNNFNHGWAMGWGWIISIFILVAIIWLISKLVFQNETAHQTTSKSALDILRERYARGEISKAEFEKKKNNLT